MLTLDEKKLRKGKPVGLPYQGSKKKISKKIVEIIKQNFGTDRPIYDIFGGGGAITAEWFTKSQVYTVRPKLWQKNRKAIHG